MMTSRKVRKFLDERYAEQLKSIRDISCSDKGEALVAVDDINGYDYDKITEKLCETRKCKLASADCICCAGRKIYLVEFKHGFAREPNMNGICKDNKCEYRRAVTDRIKRVVREQLKESMYKKMADSYLTFDKLLLPQCEDDADHPSKKLIYIMVIDIKKSPVEYLEFMQQEVADYSTDYDNVIANLYNGSKKYQGQPFYDEVIVTDNEGFARLIR